MNKIEYVHELMEGQKYIFLDKNGQVKDVYTFERLFYAGEEHNGPDGIFVKEQEDPLLWKEIPLIFSVEDSLEDKQEILQESKVQNKNYDPYFDYEDYVVMEMEM